MVLGNRAAVARGISMVVAVTLVGAASVCFAPVAAAAPTSGLPTWTADSIVLRNGGVAWDGDDHLLVSVSSREPVIGNHLVELDTSTGALGRSVYVGSEPGDVDVSDDGTRAYVALGDSPVVVEVDLTSFTVVRRIRLAAPGPEVFVTDLEVQPSDASVFAAALSFRGEAPTAAGVVIVDDGVPRDDVVGATPIVTRLAFASTSLLYGYDDRSADGAVVSVLEVDGDGVAVTATHPAEDAGRGTTLVYGGGRLYTRGATIFPTSWAVNLKTGGGIGVAGFDVANDQVYRHLTGFTSFGVTLVRGDSSSGSSINVQVHGQSRQVEDVGVGLVVASSGRIGLAGPGIDLDDFAAPIPDPELQQRDVHAHIGAQPSALIASEDERLLFMVERQSSTLTRLDPVTGQPIEELQAPRVASVLALSDDGSSLYLGANEGSVVEVDTATMEVRRLVALSVGGQPVRPTSIAPVPGEADAYVVAVADRIPFQSQNHYTEPRGVVLVRGGVVQPDTIATAPLPSSVAFAGDPAVVYGIDGLDDGRNLSTIAVAEDGLTETAVHEGVVGPTDSNDPDTIAGHEGLLYATSGEVVDPLAAGGPLVEGSFRGYASLDHQTVLPDVESGRAFVVGSTYAVEADLDERWIYGLPTDVPPIGSDRDVTALAGGNVYFGGFQTLERTPLAEVSFPGVPLAAEADAFDDRVVVSWDEPLDDGGSPVTGYEVHRDGELIDSVDGAVLEVVDTDVEEGELYWYEVTAVNAEGESARTFRMPAIPGSFVSFPDVAEGHPFWAEVRWAVVHGITTGYPDGTFRPSGAVTRQSMAAFLYRLGAGEPELVDGGPFVDVGEQHPFVYEITWAVDQGITTGYQDGTFRPGAPVTRQAMTAFLYRFAGEPPVDPAPPTFSDVSASHPFFTEVSWAVHEGITGGYVDGTFRPGATVTRQAAAAFLFRLAEG